MQRDSRLPSTHRHGDGSSEVTSVEILDAVGRAVASVASGAPIAVRVRSRFHARVCDPMVGILIRTRIGMEVYGTNTRIEKKSLGDLEPGDELEVNFLLECWLTPQTYTLTVATQNADGSSHDWLDDAIAFDVVDTRHAAGVANLRARIESRVSR